MAVRTFNGIYPPLGGGYIGLYGSLDPPLGGVFEGHFGHFWAILDHFGLYWSLDPPWGGYLGGHFGAKIGQKEQYLWGKRVQNPPNRACRTKGYPLVLHLRGVKKNNFSGGKKGPFLTV